MLGKKWFGLLLTLICITSPATAGNFSTYAGVGAGLFSLDYSEVQPTGRLGLKKSTWGGFLKGGISYKDHVAFELRTGLTGNAGQSYPVGTIGSARPLDVTVGMNTFISYLIIPKYEFEDLFRVYGVLGGTAGKIAMKSTGGVQQSSGVWKTGFTFGLGLEYQFRLKGSLAVEWTEYWSGIELGQGTGTLSKGSFRGVSVMVNKFF